MTSEYEMIDDYETIINYLYNNSEGFENKYALYTKNITYGYYDIVDLSTMSATDLIDLLERKPLYIKKEKDNAE